MECKRSIQLVLLTLALLTLGISWGCHGPARIHRGPIILITVGGLRADVVGSGSLEPSWAPHLGGWNLGWRGTAVTASSEPVVALTSLLTGARPWQHQRLRPDDPRRHLNLLPSLARALGRIDYRCRAYLPATFKNPLGDGFDQVNGPLSDEKASVVLGELSDGEFLWIHLTEAETGREGRRRGRGRKFERQRLLAYANPENPLPFVERRSLWDAYEKGVRRVDTRIGRFVDLLRQNPAWDRTTLLITGSHGSEFGEHGQILYGENLGRESLEVPLLTRWPKNLEVTEVPGKAVAQTRIWATVAEVVGLEPAPMYPSSLFHADATPILSELYGGNGVNRFSLIASGYQLHWTTRFNDGEPEYYPARRVKAGARARILSEPMARIFGRLDKAFLQSQPLSGPPNSDPDLIIERWLEDGATEVVDAPIKAQEMALELKRRWLRFADRERTPAKEQKPKKILHQMG